VASIALILVSTAHSEARALTNLIGNGRRDRRGLEVGGRSDVDRMRAHLNNEPKRSEQARTGAGGRRAPGRRAGKAITT